MPASIPSLTIASPSGRSGHEAYGSRELRHFASHFPTAQAVWSYFQAYSRTVVHEDVDRT